MNGESENRGATVYADGEQAFKLRRSGGAVGQSLGGMLTWSETRLRARAADEHTLP